MLNRKYYPFERNSYYYGKLLTAKDFESEQKYFNDKRRFMNRMGGANGIVSGLGVIMADDASVVIQAGCAMDASGREIVVPETRVLKLSTIEGYSQLTTDSALLGIEYDEQPADQVYSVMNEESGSVKYNKTREQYKLTLLDENLAQTVGHPLDAYVAKTVLYADSDVEISQYSPSFVARGSDVSIRVQITRTGLGQGEYGLLYTLDTPGFTNTSGNSSTEISLNNVHLAHGEVYTATYTFRPEAHIFGGSSVAITAGNVNVRRGEDSFVLNNKVECTLKPVEMGLTDMYLQSVYGKAMDKVLSESYDERLWLARITFIRQNNAAIIEHVAPAPFGQYCYNAQQLMAMRRLEEFYPIQRQGDAVAAAVQSSGTQAKKNTQTTAQAEQQNAPQGVSGVFDLPLGLGYDPRVPVISQEIMHGLGKGPVYVDVGVEYITADGRGDRSEIILGNANIFAGDAQGATEERLYNLSTAVKLLPERGTFQVGVQLGVASGVISLRIRWYAFKLGESNQKIKQKQQGERMLLVSPDTIVLQPKSTTHISPAFVNMPSEACKFSIADAEGGTIDNNGLYTAPAKEGVYEIRVEAISDPTVFTHVFIIVTQKKKD